MQFQFSNLTSPIAAGDKVTWMHCCQNGLEESGGLEEVNISCSFLFREFALRRSIGSVGARRVEMIPQSPLKSL